MKSFTDISTIEELIQYTLVDPSYLSSGGRIDQWIKLNFYWLKDYITFDSEDIEYCNRNVSSALRYTILTDYWYAYADEPEFPVILDLYRAATAKK